jgi:hypothetical protein
VRHQDSSLEVRCDICLMLCNVGDIATCIVGLMLCTNVGDIGTCIVG